MTTKPARRPRIEEHKPVQIAKVLQVFAISGDLRQAADTAGCHVTTIRRLLKRDTDGFALVKRTIAAKSLELSAAAQAVAVARVGGLNGYQAAIAGKIASQQAQEILDTLPPDSGIDVGAELAKVDREIELLEAMLDAKRGAAASVGSK